MTTVAWSLDLKCIDGLLGQMTRVGAGIRAVPSDVAPCITFVNQAHHFEEMKICVCTEGQLEPIRPNSGQH